MLIKFLGWAKILNFSMLYSSEAIFSDEKKLLVEKDLYRQFRFISWIYSYSLPWLKSVGGIVIKKDITQDSNSSNWDGGNVGMVIEFDSKIAAKKAFYSDVFQNYLISRELTDLVTISTL